MSTQFWRKPITFDRSLFTVIRMYGSLGLEGVTEPDATREQIVAAISTGQIDRVVAVIEFNPVEGWSRDVTAAIREEVDAARTLQAAE